MDLKYIDIGINLMGKQFASDRDLSLIHILEPWIYTIFNE